MTRRLLPTACLLLAACGGGATIQHQRDDAVRSTMSSLPRVR